MQLEKIDLGETGCFTTLFLDYLNQKPEIRSFYNQYPSSENFKVSLKNRSFSLENRKVLHEVILDQYGKSCSSIKVKDNIDLLLLENTYTVTTGHQLNIFTGPLYFIYKIITTINTCKVLKEKYPEYNFVPMYWMASEDHDFEEINHFYLFGKKLKWEGQSGGAVGRMSPEGILESIAEAGPIPEKFKEAYQKYDNLADATRHLVNELFGGDGLVIIDPDRRALKDLFKDTIKKEAFERKSSELVNNTTGSLEKLGYKSQISARNINLFYLDKGLRERIEWDGTKFKVLNSSLSFSESQLNKLIDEEPEKFSPNVVLRPVYQEAILPNLGYIGGPAEVVYWLQLKEVFSHYNIPFPILMPRNFVMLINKANVKKFNKLNIPSKYLFLEENALKTLFIEENSENSFHLHEEVSELEKVFGLIKEKAAKIDKSLIDFVGAENHRAKAILEGIEKKLKKAEEKNQEIAITQLIGLKSKLFPDGELQERHDNFLNFYINDPQFIEKLAAEINPLEFKFNVLIEDE